MLSKLFVVSLLTLVYSGLLGMGRRGGFGEVCRRGMSERYDSGVPKDIALFVAQRMSFEELVCVL